MKNNMSLTYCENKSDLVINKTTLERLPYSNKIIDIVLKKIESRDINTLKEDTLGILFEELIREQERKDLGQFYTPQEIVDYIINYLDIKPDSKILDPTCGCGVFLVTAYNFLRRKNAEAIKNIYGVDLNETATKITRINLWLRNGQNVESLNILEDRIRVGNSIVENKKIDKKAFNWKEKFSSIIQSGGFDFIIGNPPYLNLKNGRDYDIKESLYSTISNGIVNSASLIISKSYELLKEEGVMAFVLPKTLLRVNSYYNLRKFILNKTKILHILDLEDYFKEVKGEQIVLFLQKTNNKEDIEKNRVIVKNFKKNIRFCVPQNIFKKHNSFLMFNNKEHYKLIEKVKGERLNEIAEIFRGISISPKSDFISTNRIEGEEPIIKGNDISKGSFSETYFINPINIKSSKSKKLRRRKIILQNIFSSESGIISCIDNKKNLNFDTVTNIVLNNKQYKLEYIYALLNSKLINYYLMYGIYNKSKLTMHTDKTYIGKIPIKKISETKQDEIIKIIKELNEDNKQEILTKLDRKVYSIYNIKIIEQKMIDNALSDLMSNKSLW